MSKDKSNQSLTSNKNMKYPVQNVWKCSVLHKMNGVIISL